MDIKTLRQYADLMEQKNLSTLEVWEGENKISLTRAAPSCGETAAPTATMAQPVAVQPVVQAPAEAAPAPVPATEGSELKSPLVGVAYAAESPGAKPFVQAGSKVKKGQTLCIIEAMKVMNEFTAPADGEILEICFEDGQLVEYGHCLFRLK